MTSVLITMLSGLAINVITRLSGKLNLSKTYVSVGLSLLLGICVYAFQLLIKEYPVQWEQVMGFMAGAYATSQFLYNLYQKIVVEGAGAEEIKKEIQKEKETKRGRKKKE